MVPHKIWNFDIGNLIREEELDGRHYVVVPMTMILEGVHTGSQGPVYYSIDELAKTPKMWNLKPIVIEHPFRGDTATDLEVYKKQSVGMVMNTHFIDGKLKAEAWIDKEKAQEKCPELLEHIAHKLPMEVSTGLFSELVLDEGVWMGEPYKGRIINIRADHLAILPRKQGACSLADGAGLLINQRKDMPDNLNIISTVINQDYVAGSLVADIDDEEDSDKENNAKPKEKSKDKPKETTVKKAIENPLQTQVFTTAEGYRITVEPPANSTFRVPEVNFGEAKEVSAPEVPVQDNAVVVDEATVEDGDVQFIELLRNMLYVAKKWTATKNVVLPGDAGKHGGRRFNLVDGELVQYGRPQGAVTSFETQEKNGNRKRLRNELVELQTPLIAFKEQLQKNFPGYTLPELEKALKLRTSEFTPAQMEMLSTLFEKIDVLEKQIKTKTDEYWSDYDEKGPTLIDPSNDPNDTPGRVKDAVFTGGQLSLKDELKKLKNEYEAFKQGKAPRKDAMFQFLPGTTDADVAEMEAELRKEAELDEGSDDVGEALRQVQTLLHGMRRAPESSQRQYAAGIRAVMDWFPVLKEIPELVKLVDSFVPDEV